MKTSLPTTYFATRLNSSPPAANCPPTTASKPIDAKMCIGPETAAQAAGKHQSSEWPLRALTENAEPSDATNAPIVSAIGLMNEFAELAPRTAELFTAPSELTKLD